MIKLLLRYKFITIYQLIKSICGFIFISATISVLDKDVFSKYLILVTNGFLIVKFFDFKIYSYVNRIGNKVCNAYKYSDLYDFLNLNIFLLFGILLVFYIFNVDKYLVLAILSFTYLCYEEFYLNLSRYEYIGNKIILLFSFYVIIDFLLKLYILFVYENIYLIIFASSICSVLLCLFMMRFPRLKNLKNIVKLRNYTVPLYFQSFFSNLFELFIKNTMYLNFLNSFYNLVIFERFYGYANKIRTLTKVYFLPQFINAHKIDEFPYLSFLYYNLIVLMPSFLIYIYLMNMNIINSISLLFFSCLLNVIYIIYYYISSFNVVSGNTKLILYTDLIMKFIFVLFFISIDNLNENYYLIYLCVSPLITCILLFFLNRFYNDKNYR